MQAFSKSLVLLFLAAVMTAPLAAQGLGPQIPSQERPAACHEPSGNVPGPGPTSHSCCQGTHHPAILQQSSISRLSLQVLALVEYSHLPVMAAALNQLPSFAIVTADPPILSPLRV
jgi:hypothetical protein